MMATARLYTVLTLLAAAGVCAGPPITTAAEVATPAIRVGRDSATQAAPASDPAPVRDADAAPSAATVLLPPPAFEDTPWQLAAFRSGDGLVEPQEGRRLARFEFAQGRLAGSAGCNRLMGRYVLEGGKLRFEPKMASTMMACPEALMAQDKAVADAFAAVSQVRRDGDLLELLDGAGQPTLRFMRVKPTPLTGQVWELQDYNNGKQAMVSALAGSAITLELRDDGTLGGFDGCNRFMSGYTIENGKLAIGPLATTRMACRGPRGADEQAAGFAAALGMAVAYRIEGDALTLTDAQGQPAVRFRSAKPVDEAGASVAPPADGEPPQPGASAQLTPEPAAPR